MDELEEHKLQTWRGNICVKLYSVVDSFMGVKSEY